MVTSTVEKLSPTRVKLLLSITPDELKPSIAHAYEHIAKDVQIPGFRKGKVPAPIIDQRSSRRDGTGPPSREGCAADGPRPTDSAGHGLPRPTDSAGHPRSPRAEAHRCARYHSARPTRAASRRGCCPQTIDIHASCYTIGCSFRLA